MDAHVPLGVVLELALDLLAVGVVAAQARRCATDLVGNVGEEGDQVHGDLCRLRSNGCNKGRRYVRRKVGRGRGRTQ